MAGFPRIELPGDRRIEAPHPEYVEHVEDLRWLLHSWVGGRTYRDAQYGYDGRGYPKRNLVRNKRDYPVSGVPDPSWDAASVDYEMRRLRTPVPAFVPECVGKHLAKVYAKEVRRIGPDPVVEWWGSVNVRGDSIDQWMKHAVAPLLMAMAQLDVLFDRPKVPDGETVRSRADAERLGLDRCVASYVLPENLVWWTLREQDETYAEVLIREVCEDGTRYRYWDAERWLLFDDDGDPVKGDGGTGEHRTGVCPVVRLFDKRNPMCRNMGMSRYWPIAEIQREYWNRDSELVLSDSLQAYPMLQAPEEYCRAGGEIAVGPNNLLPMMPIKGSNGSTSGYQGFAAIDWPKDSAESIRQNLAIMRDLVDRYACLTKPAGTPGTTGNTVAQSGVSKQMDAVDGNDMLSAIADSLARCEVQMATMAYRVLTGGRTPPTGSIRVDYPAEFGLLSADEMASQHGKLILDAASAGTLPTIDSAILKRRYRRIIPGLTDAEYAPMDAEIAALVAANANAAAPDPADFDPAS